VLGTKARVGVYATPGNVGPRARPVVVVPAPPQEDRPEPEGPRCCAELTTGPSLAVPRPHPKAARRCRPCCTSTVSSAPASFIKTRPSSRPRFAATGPVHSIPSFWTVFGHQAKVACLAHGWGQNGSTEGRAGPGYHARVAVANGDFCREVPQHGRGLLKGGLGTVVGSPAFGRHTESMCWGVIPGTVEGSY
jgi:hypothetical protein